MKKLFFALFIFPTVLFGEQLSSLTDLIPNINLLNLVPSTNTNCVSNNITNNLEEKLFTAISTNDIKTALQLLEIVDVNSRNDHYQTPLMITSDKTIEVARILLDKKTYINTRDNEGNTALILASKNGQLNLVNLLLAHPEISINSKNKDSYSAFHHAVLNGHTEIAKVLIKKQADILDPLPNKVLPIIEATKQGFTMILSCLLDRGLSVNTTIKSTKTSLLSIASAYGNISTVQLLLDKGANANLPNHLGITPIFISIGKQYHEITELLLRNGAKIDIQTTEGITLQHIIQPDDITTPKLFKKYSKK